jgi:hypothetical protein
MQKKYKLIFCLSIAAGFLFFHIFNDTDENLLAENDPSPVLRKQPRVVFTTSATNDDVAAAIVIMPKSYLPALKRFSNSKMAKNIKILPAKIKLKDGEMTAVHQYDTSEKKSDRRIAPTNDLTHKSIASDPESLPKNEKQMLATGFVYLLANMHRNKLLK